MKMKNYLLILCTFISSVVFPQTGTTISGSFMSGGVSRTYTYYVPAMYDGSTAVPLVVNLHGLSGSSVAQENYEDFRKIADTANFIILHPQGTGPFALLVGWSSMGTVASGVADRNFLMSLLDTIEAKLNINSNKIYSTGFSQGGFMSYNLGCLHSQRFAAIAPCSGKISADNFAACAPTHPLPVMHIHGTTDGLISFTGAGVQHVDTLVQHWVCFNNCNPLPTIDTVLNINSADNSKAIHYTYSGGTDGATVEYYKVDNGGHQVPSELVTLNEYGTGNRNRDFTAANVIWEFFRKYSLSTLTSTPSSSCLTTSTGINESVSDNTVSIYPNPSTGIFYVQSKNNSNTTLTILNVLGITVLEKKIVGSTEIIDLSTVPAGVYFYRVANQNENINSGKLVVE